MKLVHFSSLPNLEKIQPEFAGTGVKGAEYKRGLPSVLRSYYYMEGTAYEPLVTRKARHKYSASLSPDQRIYDLGSDPEGHVKTSIQANGGAADSDDFLGRIRSAGYYGFTNSNSDLPNVIGLFYEHPVSQDLGESIVDKKLGTHVIFSTENPAFPGEDIFSLSSAKAVDVLRSKGVNARLAKGQYGSPENSIFVDNPTPEHIKALQSFAKNAGQESIVVSDGQKHKLLYVNGPNAGKWHPGEGTTFHDTEPDDFFTSLPAEKEGEAPTTFTHDFDFDKLISPADEEHAQAVSKVAEQLLRW